MAEKVGFEPTELSLACFQDRCTRPLCDFSTINGITTTTINYDTFFIFCQEHFFEIICILSQGCFLFFKILDIFVQLWYNL